MNVYEGKWKHFCQRPNSKKWGNNVQMRVTLPIMHFETATRETKHQLSITR